MDKSHTFHLYKYSEVVNCLQNEDDELPTKESYAPLAKALVEV